MPSWVKDEDMWEKAKKKVKEIKDKKQEEFSSNDWGLVTHIYKNMGGKIAEIVNFVLKEARILKS